MIKRNAKIILLAIILPFLFAPIFIHAETNTTVTGSTPSATNPNCGILDSGSGCYQPLSPIIDPGTNATISTADFPTYLQAIYRIGIGLCFVLGVIMFTWAGIEYIVSESMNTKSDAKKRIVSALTGLAIALVSYILLNTINPDLIKLKNLNISSTPTP